MDQDEHEENLQTRVASIISCPGTLSRRNSTLLALPIPWMISGSRAGSVGNVNLFWRSDDSVEAEPVVQSTIVTTKKSR